MDKKEKQKKAPEVVTCGTAFPISSKPKRVPRVSKHPRPTTTAKKLLDWHETAQEVRKLGSTGFTGKDKGVYEDEEYFRLVGRRKKKQHIPLPILRGMRKKAKQREDRRKQEAKEAGIVLPKAEQVAAKPDSTYRNFGPAPNIGFMKNGVFRVQKGKR